MISQILKAAKAKTATSNRYSNHWILYAIPSHMRSSATYILLRDLKIHPLPCISTIHTYLKRAKSKGGFDERYLALLERKLASLIKQNPRDQWGLLTLDEMGVREGICVDTADNSIGGIVDYKNAVNKGQTKKVFPGQYAGDSSDSDCGEEIKQISGGQANHALVFMFRSLFSDFAHPIGVFPSSGPAKADVLGILLLQAITNVEKAGGKVLGVVCDGASTNKKMYANMEVEGKYDKDYENSLFDDLELNEEYNPGSPIKHWINNPVDENRKIYLISDVPHIMECIRNRLFNQKTLLVNNPFHILII